MSRAAVGLLEAVDERTETKVTTPTTTALTTRGPVLYFWPTSDLKYAPLEDDSPDWAILDQVRERAWKLGISDLDLALVSAAGYCPAQVEYQIRELTAWCAERERMQALKRTA